MAEQEKVSNYWTSARVNELMRKADEEGLDYKSVDNPFHENDPELKKGNVLFEMTAEEIEELKKCASSVIYFANKYCHVMTDEGVKQVVLRDYQEQILTQYQNNRFNVFLSPRQYGKCGVRNMIITSMVNNVTSKKTLNSLLKSREKNILKLFKDFLYKLYSLL